MVEVSAGLLVGVDVGGWEELGESVGGQSHGPSVFVYGAVMAAAQKNPVAYASVVGNVDVCQLLAPARP